MPSEHSWKVILFEKWPSIIGNMRGKVRIEKVDGTTLILGVCHPAWAQELYLLSPMLKKKINELFDKERIQVIRFKTINFKSQGSKKEKIFSQASATNQPPIALDTNEKVLLENIKDETLRMELERFGILCKSKKNKLKKGN